MPPPLPVQAVSAVTLPVVELTAMLVPPTEVTPGSEAGY